MQRSRSAPPGIAWVLLLALGTIWGAAFMATGIATAGFQPFTLASGRLIIGSATLLTYLALSGDRLPGFRERRFWAFAFGAAFLANALPFVSLSWAQRHVPSGLAGVFMAAVPLMVLPLGHFFVHGERMTARRVTGMAIGFAGVIVLIGPGVLAGLGAGGLTGLLAQIACLLAAFGYASGGIVSKLAPAMGLLRFAAATLLLAAMQVIPFALVFETPFAAMPGAAPLLAMLYLGVVPTALAMVMLLAVLARTGPGFLSLVNYQVPLWAILFGVVFLGEELPGRIWPALALIMAGLAISQNVLAIRRGGHARG